MAVTSGNWDRLSAAVGRRPLAAVLAAAALTRLVVVGAALWGRAHLDALPPGTWNIGPEWTQGFARWDSGYYLDIATLGYGHRPELWAFHPGYPASIAFLHALAPGVSPEAIGVLVSNASFFVALPLFFALTRELFDAAVAARACLAFACFPGAFFMSAVYPEALFMAALLGCLWAAQRGRWAAAGLLASAAAAVRPQGLFLVPVLVLAAVRSRPADAWARAAAWGSPLLALAFPLGFSWYAWTQTGDALRWMNARPEFWPNVGLHDPVRTVAGTFAAFGRANPWPLVGLLLLVGAIGFVVWDHRRSRAAARVPAYAYALILSGVYLAYAETTSLLRFLLPVLPLFWLAGRAATRPWAVAAAAAVGVALSALVAVRFAMWHPPY